MLKSCQYCGRIHKKNDCEKKSSRVSNRKVNEMGRYTVAMTKKSLKVKELANYLCEFCFSNGILNYTALETHHIVKIQDQPDLVLNSLNLVCLCRNCHEKAEKGAINASYLHELAKKREKNSPPAF